MRWLALLVLWALPAFAQPLPADRLPNPAAEARAQTIGREIRCMVCQGQSIEDSDADLARDLRRIIREKLVAGQDEGQIREFLHARYGDFILLRPPFSAATALLWATPVLALGFGILMLVLLRRRATPPVPALSAEEEAALAKLKDNP